MSPSGPVRPLADDSSSLHVAACYCGWTPAALITLVYLSMSLLTRWVSSPREFVTASAPFFSNWFFISGDCAIFTSSPCSRLRIGVGVPLRAKNPTHSDTANPGYPDSATVGTSGRDG